LLFLCLCLEKALVLLSIVELMKVDFRLVNLADTVIGVRVMANDRLQTA
jgi:hypothetical protein